MQMVVREALNSTLDDEMSVDPKFEWKALIKKIEKCEMKKIYLLSLVFIIFYNWFYLKYKLDNSRVSFSMF